MNQLATKNTSAVVIPENTRELIQAGVSETRSEPTDGHCKN